MIGRGETPVYCFGSRKQEATLMMQRANEANMKMAVAIMAMPGADLWTVTKGIEKWQKEFSIRYVEVEDVRLNSS